jgi:hypothetical protein
MTGAHKCTYRDALHIKLMISEGLTNSEIHKTFISEKGHQISRAHIDKIRKGQRWNSKIYSFVPKDELKSLKKLTTKINDGSVFHSEIGKVITYTDEKWIYLHFKDTLLVRQETYLIKDEKTAVDNFAEAHHLFVSQYL